MSRFLWVCLAGAAGTAARYLISGWVLAVAGAGFPWGTLAVNAMGSFLIGAVMQVGLTTQLISPATRIVVTTGFLGGFTTYSAFNYESFKFFQDGAWLLGLANVLVMLCSCLAAGAAGVVVSRLLFAH